MRATLEPYHAAVRTRDTPYIAWRDAPPRCRFKPCAALDCNPYSKRAAIWELHDAYRSFHGELDLCRDLGGLRIHRHAAWQHHLVSQQIRRRDHCRGAVCRGLRVLDLLSARQPARRGPLAADQRQIAATWRPRASLLTFPPVPLFVIREICREKWSGHEQGL